MDMYKCRRRHSRIISSVGDLKRRRLGVSLLVALFLLCGMGLLGPTAQQKVAHAAGSNPIVTENQQAGTTSWQFDNFNKEAHHEIEGYASLTSVNKGSQISFMVSLSANAQYTMSIYRMGYYFHGTNPDGSACSGCGGRLMQSVGPLNGTTQAACPTTTSGADFGMIECQWTPSYTLTVPTSWTTGNYIVKLKRLDDNLENYLTFVVRDDSGTADIVYSMDVTTWQAYSYWSGAGNKNIGYNLYGEFNDSTQAFVADTRAYTVSFDRPYMDQGSEDGAGNFMVWDYPMIHWMESQGYNITYVTDVDLESNPNLFNGHKVFVNTGHDEYYSDNMRANVKNFINSGGSAAFFSADDISRRMTWSNSISGQPDRREHCDKGALAGSTTVDWRATTPPQPENQITGSLSNGAAAARPFLVYDATSWVFAGTGLVNYNGTVVTSGTGQNAIKGLIGYEFSTRAVNDSNLSAYVQYEPAGLQQVGHSFVPASDNGVNSWADTTLYTSSGGGIVFSAGTIEWSWGVDNGFNDGFCDCNTGFANTDSQIITANVLNKLVGTPAPAVSLSPASLSFGNQNVGTTSATQTVTLTNTGTSTLTINSITLTGTNASDFAQSNNCPISPATLATSASCTLSVAFTPSSNGAKSASVSISDNAAGSPQTVSLLGTGVTSAPVVTLNPTTVNFGNQNVGTTSSAQAITLTNTGTIALTINSITLTGTNTSDFAQSNNCPISPSTLAVNGSCTLNVTFTPSANGARNASVSINDNAAGSPQSVTVSGMGVTPAPAVTLNPTSVNFGNQNVGTTSAAQSVTMTNTGTSALTISGIGLTGKNASDFAQSNNCPGSLAINASCTISVTFTPSGNGARSGTVNISDNAGGSPQSVTLNGTGVTPAPSVNLNPTNLTFGNQNVGTTSAAQSVTLTNNGTSALTITGIALAGTNPGDFAESSTCPVSPNSLAVNASCTISVTFTPGATGPRSASVNISDNATGSPQSVTLSGTGVTHTPGVSLIASATANGDFGGGVDIKIPSVQAGDLLIAVAGTNGSPSSWTTPTGWNVGAGAGQPDGQGLNWWWKIASGSESGTTLTLKASSFADGGGVVLVYRGAAATPIEAVSALGTNDNGGNGDVTSAQFNAVSWNSSASVVSLLLMSWQPVNATVNWPAGYTLQATDNDGYSSVMVGANLTAQTASSLGAQTATLSVSQAVVPTLQIAVLVGS
ncbi:MAG TPA: choice-of-anchor D domain-containing protein [Ktedonobacteraceae bacterium]|nr:choice-of-anchor D domain-containing protein [Ktedonobacteraceae bacterium]